MGIHLYLKHVRLLVPSESYCPSPQDLDSRIQAQVYSLAAPTFTEDAFVVLPHPVPPSVLENLRTAPGVAAVQVLGAGVDHLRGSMPDGIPLFRAPQFRAAATAELAIFLSLASIMESRAWFANLDLGVWEWPIPQGRLGDKSVAILGNGYIGTRIARLLTAFDAVSTLYGRSGNCVSLDRLPDDLGKHDVVILALALTPSTQRYFDAELLGRMRDGSSIVNVARGGLIDTSALTDVAGTGRIRVALDVTDPEPLPAAHPLWHMPNVIITPHVGGNVPLDPAAVRQFLASQCASFFSKRSAEYLVDRSYYL